ncbi:translin [Methanohalophilus levihalophilus]|uniref:haloacid dehalogenase n=1 Tax=Methanohalophilus levihalophilus TaxID=1431282 RepID=UPI001AE4E2F9|nr:haloacid dehalogenase [Methanohalophilus levihalophilus]MBP2031322.1 translin [Methanohalophilus levihalophilus]
MVPEAETSQLFGILERLDSRDRVREKGLILARNVVRCCRKSIMGIHRGDIKQAISLKDEAAGLLKEMHELLSPYPELYYSGTFDTAQQEYVECYITYELLCEKKILPDIPGPEELGVKDSAYLNGLADTGGELRRHILDMIMKGQSSEGKKYLDMMDNIYSLLVMFDHPDALTSNLRRRTDVMRSLTDKTRGELASAIKQRELQQALNRTN